MLRTLRRHPVVRGIVEVVADATLYVVALLVLVILFGRLVELAAAAA